MAGRGEMNAGTEWPRKENFQEKLESALSTGNPELMRMREFDSKSIHVQPANSKQAYHTDRCMESIANK